MQDMDKQSSLDTKFVEMFVRMVEASTQSVDDYDGFCHFVRKYIRPIFPHEMLIVVIGRVTFDCVTIEEIIPVDYPLLFVNGIKKNTNLKDRPLVAEWLVNKTPLLIDSEAHSHRMSELELREINEFKLGNLAIHGQIDVSQRMATYFSFARIPELACEYERRLELIVPHLHNMVVKIYRNVWSERNQNILTRKEMEILKWIVSGKTNGEIATILSKSEKTVRNQVQSILRKMEVANRSELVMRSDELGILGNVQDFKSG